ncbi:AMP-binding protein, partial [Klebsiella pneumoniae]|nr:AMP-binding protein [Klebsiella pneumoniae]
CGDRVVLWGPNSIDWAVAALAVTYAGAVLVPVNSRYVGAEVADVVERTQAPLVVVHDGFLGRDQVAELSDAGVERGRILTLERLGEGAAR